MARTCGVMTTCWLTAEKREQARDPRVGVAEAGDRTPLDVVDGNYLRARDVPPGGTPTAQRARPGSAASPYGVAERRVADPSRARTRDA